MSIFYTVNKRFSVLLLLLSGVLISGVLQAETKLSTIKVEKQIVPNMRVVDATIEAVQQATVSSQVTGRIVEISVDVDDYVQKGTVIIRFRNKQQQAAYNAAKARFEEASTEYNRINELRKKDLVAKSALDKAEAYAANTLLVNTNLLMPAGYPATRSRLEKLGLAMIELEVSEIRKMDGGLTCMSLRF